MKFKQYRRKSISEMREVESNDIEEFKSKGKVTDEDFMVSISEVDLKNGSPKLGDMIARNPKNHFDKWLVAKDYFEENLEEIKND